MDEAHLKEIATSLSRISKILAGLLLRDLAELDQGTKILRLRSCGFSNKEIAEMLHTTPLTVQVTASQIKSKKKRFRTPKRNR